MVIHLCLCRVSALDIACLANLWRTHSVLLSMRPRDRDPVLFVWYTLLLFTTVLYESARFLCGHGKDYAAAIRGLGRRMRFAGCVPFDVPHGM